MIRIICYHILTKYAGGDDLYLNSAIVIFTAFCVGMLSLEAYGRGREPSLINQEFANTFT